LPASGYPAGTDVRTLYTRLFDAVSATPAIAAAGLSTDLPLGVSDRRAFVIDNEPAMAKGLSHALAPQWVFGEYFAALGIPLKRGRVFTMQDTAASEPVVIINETLARTFWGDADPVGERMAWGTGPDNRGAWMRIVGVVGDVKHSGLDVQTIPQAYNPWLQVSDAFLAENVVGMMRSLKLAIRAEKDPATVVGAVRQLVHAIDPALPVNVQTMNEIVQTSIATQRFNTTLLSLFALLALLLAAIGLGGVLATSVSQRTKEIGLRLALGAQHGSLVRMVVRQGMLPALIGLGIGLFLALRLVTPAMSTLLFEIEPMDALTCLGAGMLLIVVAMTACAIPAWRATRIDPMVTLRRD
jgi:putative ABC transport system permease protein